MESELDDSTSLERDSAIVRSPDISRSFRAGSRSEARREVSGMLSGAVRQARRLTGAGADWVEKNPIATIVFAGLFALAWSTRRKCVGPAFVTAGRGPAFETAGAWYDLAAATGAQSRPAWIPMGSGLDIWTAQFYLNRVAGARLVEDGILGPKTARALRNFQEHNGIYPSGTIDEETGGALEYLFNAVSQNRYLKAAAAMSPDTMTQIARGHVTYSPYPMSETVSPEGSFLPTGVIPPELSSAVRYYEALARSAPRGPHPRTGIQSTSMSDPRNHYDVPAHFVDWGPGPYGGWDASSSSWDRWPFLG